MTHAHYGVHPFAGPTGGDFPREEVYTLSGGPGETPTAALVVYGASALTLDGRNATARMSIGATDGTNQRVVCIIGEDGDAAATAHCGGRADTDTVIQITGLNSSVFQNEARFISFGTDSITLDWNSGSNGNGYIVFFYCDDAAVGHSTSSASIGGTASVSGFGFQPDAVIAASVAQTISANAQFTEAMLSYGFAGRLPSVTQACAALVGENLQANTSSACIARDDCFATVLLSAAGVVSESTRLEMTSFDSGGYTYTTRNAAVAIDHIYLAIKVDGRACFADAPLVAVGATGTEAIPGCGFTPGLLLVSTPRLAVVNTINANQATLGAGATEGTGTANVSARIRDNLATSDTYSTASATSLIHLVETSAADDYIANFSSFDADGFTIDVTDASSGAEDRPIAYLAIEERPLIEGAETVQISDAAVFVTHSMATSETVNISDDIVISPTGGANVLVASETVQIGDALAVTQYILAPTETVNLDDREVLRGTGVGAIANETVQISDSMLAYLGVILGQTTESIQIGDDFSSGDGLVAMPVGRTGRGKTVQAGAEMGATAQAGAKKGVTLS